MSDDVTKLLSGCLAIIAVFAAFVAIIGFPIKWLWNWLMPHLFGLPEISFWMALGIAALVSFLFGGIIKMTKEN